MKIVCIFCAHFCSLQPHCNIFVIFCQHFLCIFNNVNLIKVKFSPKIANLTKMEINSGMIPVFRSFASGFMELCGFSSFIPCRCYHFRIAFLAMVCTFLLSCQISSMVSWHRGIDKVFSG